MASLQILMKALLPLDFLIDNRFEKKSCPDKFELHNRR